ncbi:MAG: hypothetical protein ACI4JJ_03470 [Huintestinicola sp.]
MNDNLKSEIISMLNAGANNIGTEWISDFFEAETGKMLRSGKNSVFANMDKSAAFDLITALKGIDSGRRMSKAAFGMKYFGSAEYFDKNVRKGVIAAAKRFEPEISEYISYGCRISEDDILAQLGIFTPSQRAELCGNIVLRTDKGDADIRPFRKGISFCSEDHENITGAKLERTDRITVIGSRKRYLHYTENEKTDEELVINAGGFLDGGKCGLIKRIIGDFGGEVRYCDDISLSGFYAFSRFCEKVCPQAMPYKMDTEEYKRLMKYGRKIDGKYIGLLDKFEEKKDTSLFRNVFSRIRKDMTVIEYDAVDTYI